MHCRRERENTRRAEERDVSGDGVGGLRGRISIAPALSLPLGEHKDLLITAISIVVFFCACARRNDRTSHQADVASQRHAALSERAKSAPDWTFCEARAIHNDSAAKQIGFTTSPSRDSFS
jgi:hypothetical protein